MDDSNRRALSDLIRRQRTASLGTLYRGAPYVSLALYAEETDFRAFYIHVSGLAIHTKNLRADSRAGLMIVEADTGAGDPQMLMRVSLQVIGESIHKDTPEFDAARARYAARLPQSGQTFDLPDFELYRLVPHEGRFIAAFGTILNISVADLREAGAL
ncbi:MAG: pyridoxamine 5'-phosphate oxidase family protein [Chloroflexi bacterium]|nr:pyridoxamine 5'-phosphate oxidase family protein [Chloroflexota bacterium]